MVITTTLVNNAPNPRVNTYHVGMNLKLFVPKSYGMYQANGLIGTITGITGNVFTVALDSTRFDAFVIPVSTSVETPASISPSGSKNLEYDNTTDLVAFQNLNNQGN